MQSDTSDTSDTQVKTQNMPSRTWKSHYRQAMSFFEANLYPQAVELFAQLIDAKGPQGHLSRFYHGLACRKEAENMMRKGQYHHASVYLDKAIETNPNSPTLLSFLADCYVKQGQYEQAGEQFDALIDVVDSTDQAKFKAALSHYLGQKADEAMAILEDLVTRHANCYDVNFQLGAILAAEGHSERSIRYLTKACELRPELPSCHWRLALAHAAIGHLGETVHHLQNAHKLDPTNNWILTHLSMAVNQARGEGLDVQVQLVSVDNDTLCERAISELSELVAAEPEFVEAFLDLPHSKMDRQIFSSLLETLMKALEHHPEYADLHYHCSRIYERLGQTDKAIEEANEALQINPRFVNALIHLARVYAETDRCQLAIDRLNVAIGNGANFADVHYMLGKLYQDQGHAEQARTHYTRALNINDDFGAAKEALETLVV